LKNKEFLIAKLDFVLTALKYGNLTEDDYLFITKRTDSLFKLANRILKDSSKKQAQPNVFKANDENTDK